MNQTTYPIYCIDHRGQTLYVELIQLVESRQLAWVRPLMLLDKRPEDKAGNPKESNPKQHSRSGGWADDPLPSMVYPLQEVSDLLCPPSLLRQAMDTEVLPLLSQAAQPSSTLSDRGRLHQFMQKVCVDNPSVFQPSKDASSG